MGVVKGREKHEEVERDDGGLRPWEDKRKGLRLGAVSPGAAAGRDYSRLVK
jgi:hypothetical protein